MTPDPGRSHVSRSNQARAPLSPRSATRGPCTRPKSSPRSLQPAKAHAAMKTHKKFKKKKRETNPCQLQTQGLPPQGLSHVPLQLLTSSTP